MLNSKRRKVFETPLLVNRVLLLDAPLDNFKTNRAANAYPLLRYLLSLHANKLTFIIYTPKLVHVKAIKTLGAHRGSECVL